MDDRYAMRGQTSTEYTVLIAIALIVVIIIVGMYMDANPLKQRAIQGVQSPVIGSFDVGITAFRSTPNASYMTLVNNLPYPVQIVNISIDQTWIVNASLPIILQADRAQALSTPSVTTMVGDRYDYGIIINYTDVSTGNNYSINDVDLRVSGEGSYD